MKAPARKHSREFGSSWLGWLLSASLLVAVAAGTAQAGKVEDLSKILLEDSSYKVRVQAALVLGKLGDRNAVSALGKALADSNNTVRAVAAQALGKLGAPEAVAQLKQILKIERDSFVRNQIERALAILDTGKAQTGAVAGGGARMYLTLGSFSGGTKSADNASLDLFRTSLKQALSTLRSASFELTQGEKDNFARSGKLGFLIDGNVTRLDDGLVGGNVEINCDVRVMVARWPSKSIILWTSAGAAVQGGTRVRDKENARRDCLQASADQVGQDLKKFFESQGG